MISPCHHFALLEGMKRELFSFLPIYVVRYWFGDQFEVEMNEVLMRFYQSGCMLQTLRPPSESAVGS